jgi:hypothetical protein
MNIRVVDFAFIPRLVVPDSICVYLRLSAVPNWP